MQLLVFFAQLRELFTLNRRQAVAANAGVDVSSFEPVADRLGSRRGPVPQSLRPGSIYLRTRNRSDVLAKQKRLTNERALTLAVRLQQNSAIVSDKVATANVNLNRC